MRRIIIIGYMGAGKTTVGRALAKETGMQFYDLDWYIEGRMHKTVAQLSPSVAKKASGASNTTCCTKRRSSKT